MFRNIYAYTQTYIHVTINENEAMSLKEQGRAYALASSGVGEWF